jgi:hypothetical protein
MLARIGRTVAGLVVAAAIFFCRAAVAVRILVPR